jgi:hypothetical protein
VFTNVLKLIKKAFAFKANIVATEQQLVEQWLSESTDLVDIERRQRMISRGQAPWQVRENNKLRGWM